MTTKTTKSISIILLIVSMVLIACEEVEEEIPLLKFDQTFNVSVESGWNRGEQIWPVATLWLSTDNEYPSSMIIHTTVNYEGPHVKVILDSIVQPEVSLPAFMRARGNAQITTTWGTNDLIFLNGNVENSFAITSEESAIRITPIALSYMELADEGDFWHPTDP